MAHMSEIAIRSVDVREGHDGPVMKDRFDRAKGGSALLFLMTVNAGPLW